MRCGAERIFEPVFAERSVNFLSAQGSDADARFLKFISRNISAERKTDYIFGFLMSIVYESQSIELYHVNDTEYRMLII